MGFGLLHRGSFPVFRALFASPWPANPFLTSYTDHYTFLRRNNSSQPCFQTGNMTDGPRSVTSRTEPPPYRGANPTAVRFWPRPYARYTRLTGLAGPPHNNNPRGGKRNTCLALLSKRPIPFFCSLAAPIDLTSRGLLHNFTLTRLNSFPLCI